MKEPQIKSLPPMSRMVTAEALDKSALPKMTRMVGKDEGYDEVFPFSSELPVERGGWFAPPYMEVLDHDEKSIRWQRVEQGAVPSVYNHDPDQLVGRITKVGIGEDRRAYAFLKWGTSEKAQEVRKDWEAGILRNVSFMYIVHGLELESEIDGMKTYRSEDWEILSVDPVTIPADPTVGQFRSTDTTFPCRILGGNLPDNPAFTRQQQPQPAAIPARSVTVMEQSPAAPSAEELNKKINDAVAAATRESAEAKARVEYIAGTAAANAQAAPAVLAKMSEAIEKNWSERQWSDFLTAELRKGNVKTDGAGTELGLDNADLKNYSIRNAILAMVGEKKDGVELEAHRELVKRGVQSQAAANGMSHSILIPVDALRKQHDLAQIQRRDQTVGTNTAGGYLVAEQRGSLVDMLRAQTIIDKLGVRRLDNAVGNIVMPRKTGSASIVWVGENSALTESSMTFGLLQATPKTMGVFVDVTRQLLLQTDGTAESLVNQDIAYGCALAEDYAVLSGSGVSGEPQGIRNISGVGSVTFSSSLDLGDLLDAELDLADAFVDVSKAKFLASSNVRKFAKTNVAYTSTASPLWEKDNTMNGYAAFATSNTTALPAGNLIFAKWDEIVVPSWGGLELATDNATGFTAGTLRIRAMKSMDVMLLQTGAVTIETSITA